MKTFVKIITVGEKDLIASLLEIVFIARKTIDIIKDGLQNDDYYELLNNDYQSLDGLQNGKV